MSMAKAAVAKAGEAKVGGGSGLLRKVRGAETEVETEVAESGPARLYPIDLNRVPLYPPGGPPARPVGWPGFANALPPMGRLATTRGVLRAKLEVGSVDDPLEQEADDVAEKVLRMPDPAAAAGAPEEPPGMPVTAAGARLSRKCTVCKAEDGEKGALVQRRAAPGVSAGMAEAPPIVEQTLRSGGRALDEETRAYFESRLRFDLSKVRVHTDARAAESARAVNALAYTVGQNIVFGQGRYAPGEREGRRLLAHELAHVAQQSPNGGAAPGMPAVRRGSAGVLRRAPAAYETRLREVVAGSIGKAEHTAAAVLEVKGFTSDPSDTVATDPDLAAAVGGAYAKLQTVLLTKVHYKTLPPDGTMRLVATSALDEPALARVQTIANDRNWKVVVYRAASTTSIVEEKTVTPSSTGGAAPPAGKSTNEAPPAEQPAAKEQPAPPATPPKGRIDDALESLRRAEAAVLEEPKDIEKATSILEKLTAFFQDIATDTKISETFRGAAYDQTSVRQDVISARGAPASLLGRTRSGERSEESWKTQIGYVVKGKRYLEILAGDRPNDPVQEPWESDLKEAAYSKLIDGLRSAKQAALSPLRSRLASASPENRDALQTFIDIADVVIDVIITILVTLVGFAVGTAGAIIDMIKGVLSLAYGIIKYFVFFIGGFFDKGEQFNKYSKELIATAQNLVPGLKQVVADWIAAFEKAPTERQSIMIGELFGQIFVFIATLGAGAAKVGQIPKVAVSIPVLQRGGQFALVTAELGTAPVAVAAGGGTGLAMAANATSGGGDKPLQQEATPKEETPEAAAEKQAEAAMKALDEANRAELDKLAQDAWQRMKTAYNKGERSATLSDGTVVKVRTGSGPSDRGPCLSLVKDTITGEVFYGQNTGQVPRGLNEPLGSRTQQVAAANQAAHPAPPNYPPGWSRKAGIPGSHSEVQAMNKALAKRPGARIEDLAIYNIRTEDISLDVAPPMPRCVNCKPITAGARALSD